VSSKRRFFVSTGVGAALALVAVLPAPAQSSHFSVQAVAVTVSKAKEFHFNVSKSALKRGVVSFKFTNGGNLPHDFKVCSSNRGNIAANTCAGKGTALISPGSSATLRVTFLKAGTYEYLCTVPGHAAAGMKGLLKLT
jgi:uncharacterized cupredoxin-like copper-binding protein